MRTEDELSDKELPRSVARCKECGGLIARRTNVALRAGEVDETQPWLHLRATDWIDHPHEAEPR